jgi:hypothetical protein
MSDALLDLHNESNGSPTLELAKEIAADYPGVNAERLMSEYPDWVKAQANKPPPQKDPEKEAMAKRYQAKRDAEEQRKEREAKREREQQERKEREQKHREENAEVFAAADAELAKFKQVPGWKVVETPPDSFGQSHGAGDYFTIANDDGIQINMWASVSSAWSNTPAVWTIHGDVHFTAGGKSYTYTHLGIDIDSFSYRQDSPEDPTEILQQQVKKVGESRLRLSGQVEVPGTHGIRVNKNEVQKIADEIRKGGTHTLAPVGFGIGYELSAKPRKWGREAPEAMKKFFGLDKLYIFQLDFD